MTFLIAILTSSRPELARLCYDSVLAQTHHSWKCAVVVVVNSVHAEHEANIRRVMEGTRAQVVVTESNGRPGKGHNSVLALFQEHQEFDYLVLIDGDDFLYPSAFHQLDKFLPAQPLCIAVQTNDGITRSTETGRYRQLNDTWRLTSWFDDCENWWLKYAIRNPFVEPIRDCVTPARPVLIHRDLLQNLPAKPYGEEFYLYDDMMFFLNICEAQYQHPQKRIVFFTSNTYIYVHHDDNTSSMTNSGVDYDREQQLFNAATAEKYTNIRRWQLKELPHAQITNPGWFTTDDKLRVATEHVRRMEDVSASK